MKLLPGILVELVIQYRPEHGRGVRDKLQLHIVKQQQNPEKY